MHKDLSFVNEVLGIEGVEVAENKVEITLEQLTTLNNTIKTNTEAVTNLTTEKDTAVTAKQTAETALNDVTAKLDAIDPSIKANADKAAAVTALLVNRPAVAPTRVQSTKTGEETVTDETDWDAINALPHNQAADKEI